MSAVEAPAKRRMELPEADKSRSKRKRKEVSDQTREQRELRAAYAELVDAYFAHPSAAAAQGPAAPPAASLVDQEAKFVDVPSSDAAAAAPTAALPVITVVIPVHNTTPYLGPCFQSVLDQTYKGPIEVSIYDDASGDECRGCIAEWLDRLRARCARVVVSGPGWKDGVPLSSLPESCRPVRSGTGRNLCVTQVRPAGEVPRGGC